MITLDMHCKWDADGVNIYINKGTVDEKVGRIPRGAYQAIISATESPHSDSARLFSYVLIPNFDEQSMKIGLIEGKMTIADCEIVVDATKNIELVKEE